MELEFASIRRGNIFCNEDKPYSQGNIAFLALSQATDLSNNLSDALRSAAARLGVNMRCDGLNFLSLLSLVEKLTPVVEAGDRLLSLFLRQLQKFTFSFK